MGILFGLLKFIGYVLLVLLVTILALLFIVLCLPFHYSFYGENSLEHGFQGKIKAFGFLHFWQMVIEEDAHESSYGIFVYGFWGKLLLFPKKKAKDNKEHNLSKDTHTINREEKESVSEENTIDSEEEVRDKNRNQELEHFQDTLQGNNSNRDDAKEDESINLEEGKKRNHKDAMLKKKRRPRSGKQNELKWKDEIFNERNYGLTKFVIEQALWLLRHIKPKEIFGQLDYSLGDPAYTGYLTGIFSMFPTVYHKQSRFSPDFASERIYFYGNLQMKGNIFLIHFIYVIIKVLLDKECRALLFK